MKNARPENLLSALVRNAGFISLEETPPGIISLLAATHPNSPDLNQNLVELLNRQAVKIYGDALGDIRFTAHDLYAVIADIARGVAYVSRKYSNTRLDEALITNKVIINEEKELTGFDAAFLGKKDSGILAIHPNILLSLMVHYKIPDLGKKLDYDVHGQEEKFTARDYARIIGIEEAYHAHQYFSGKMEQPGFHLGTQSVDSAYTDDPDEKDAEKALGIAIRELGLGVKGRRK